MVPMLPIFNILIVVKPVYNDHLRDPKKWSLLGGLNQESFNKKVKFLINLVRMNQYL